MDTLTSTGFLGLCRSPDMVEYARGEVVDGLINGRAFMGDTNHLIDGNIHVSYGCANCGRFAHHCPKCGEVRCQSHLRYGRGGAIPTSCRNCEERTEL